MAWRLARVLWRDREQLNEYLANSWEPFAVTEPDEATVWLRRSASPADAGVTEQPGGPRHEPEVRGS